MAQKIPKEVINDIQERANIVDIISKYVQLKKRGTNYFGLCPFQEEKTPSFSVNEDKKIFHCFSCGRGGSVFTFMMLIDKLDFSESVAKVADLSGIPFDSVRYLTAKRNVPSENSAVKVLDFAKELYQHILNNTESGTPALEYLTKRRITKDAIDHFQLGYAPIGNILSETLKDQDKFSLSDIKETNLLNYSDTRTYDYFRDRIVVPIFNENNILSGFGGRSITAASDEPKYLNSKQSKLFDKGDILFNLNEARKEIALLHEVVLLEGYFDVISAWQSGVYNAVASMGTSFTAQQLNLLKRLSHRVVLVYDGDLAGKAAIDKAIKILNKEKEFEVLVAPLPGGLDPDEYIKKYGSDSFKTLVNKNRVSQYRFLMDYYQENLNLKNEQDLITYVDLVLKSLVNLRDKKIEQEVYLKELSDISGISSDSLKSQFVDYLKKDQENTKRFLTLLPKVKNNEESRYERAQNELLFLILHDPSIIDLLENRYKWIFPNTDKQIIYDFFKQFVENNSEEFNFSEFLNELPDDLTNATSQIYTLNRPKDTDEKEIADLVKVILQQSLENKITKLQKDINDYQRLGQTDKLEESIRRMIELIRIKQQEVS